MREQMAPQIKMMKEQMAGLDPATRKMLEQRMGGMARNDGWCKAMLKKKCLSLNLRCKVVKQLPV